MKNICPITLVGSLFTVTRKTILTIILSILFSATAFAQPTAPKVWFVKRGVNIGDTSSTINAAIIRATSNDTILIYPGTYNESINVRDKSFVLASTFTRTNNRTAITSTIIDGTGVSDQFLRNATSQWNGTDITIIGLTISNFQNQLTANNEFRLKLFNDIFFANGSNDQFLQVNYQVEINNCEFSSNNGRISFNTWDQNRRSHIQNSKFFNHNLSSGWMINDGPGLIEINNRGFYNISNNLFFNCSGTASNFLIKHNLNENDSLLVVNNSFLNNDINVFRSTSRSYVLFQNNLLNSNVRNANTELTFTASTKIRFQRNVTFQALNRFVGFGLVDTTGSDVNFVFKDLKLINKNNPNSALNKYYPSDNSPFLGLGKLAGAPLRDHDGVLRPTPAGSAPEIGAFESNLSLVPPVLTVVEAVQTNINLSWVRNPGEKDDKVNIYRSTTGLSNSWVRIASVNIANGESFVDNNNIVLGTKYFYAISLVGVNGDTSILSNSLSVIPVTNGPSVPANIKISSSPSRIRVYWDKANSVDTIKYNIYRSNSATGNYGLLQANVNNNFFVDTTVNRGLNYFYKIRSVNKENNASELSNAVSIATNGKKWFVSNRGSNTDIGSEEYPFLTISNALKNTLTGDTIVLFKGTYPTVEGYTIDTAVTIMSYFPLNNDSSFIRETIITGESISNNGPLFRGVSSRLSFAGLTFKDVVGQFATDEKQYFVQSCRFENINTTRNWDVTFQLANRSLFRFNTFTNLGGHLRVAYGATLENNQFLLSGSTIWSNDTKIRIESFGTGRNVTSISNNLFVYDKKLISINVNSSTDSIYLSNNTFISKGGSGNDNFSIQFLNRNYKLILRNNIFYPTSNFSFGPVDQNSNVHIYATNNILSEPLGSYIEFKNFNVKDTSQNIINIDPGFRNINANDFSLSNKSIALGRGTSEGLVRNDIVNAERPAPLGSNPDIGAYENIFSISTPTILTAEGSDRKVTLYWEQLNPSNVRSFNIYKTGPNIDNTLAQTTPYATVGKDINSFIDSISINNIDKYYYRIKAIDTTGSASDFSNLIIGRANIQPIRPTNLTVNASPGIVLLKWSHSAPQNLKYNIYRGLSSNSLNLISTGVSTSFFIDSTISRAVTYFYAVKAVDSVGASSIFSDIREVKSVGRTWYVDTVKRADAIGSKELPFNQIARALKFATAGDSIKLQRGEYFEQIRLNVKPIFIVSSYVDSFDESAINSTIVNGSRLSSTAHLIIDSSRNFSNFAFFNGITFKKAPSLIFNADRIELDKVNITDNIAANGLFRGAYVLIDSVRVTANGTRNSTACCETFTRLGDSSIVRNSYFSDNIIRDNGLLYFDGFDTRKAYGPIVENNRFEKNSALNNWNNFVFVIGTNVRNIIVRNNIFNNNDLFVFNANPSNWENSNLHSHDFVHNTVVSNRGGIRFDANRTGIINVVNNLLQGNQVSILVEGTNSATPQRVNFINNIIGTNLQTRVLRDIANIGFIDTTGSVGNFAAETNFVDTLRGNYKLNGLSKAIGNGHRTFLSQQIDFDNRTRPNPANSRPDIGAFESAAALAAPVLTSVEGSDKKVYIQWEHTVSDTKTRYFIYRSISPIDSLGNLSAIDSVDARNNTYIDSVGLSNLTRYFYRLKVKDNVFNPSAYTNELSVTPNKPLPPPDSIKLEAAAWRLKVSWIDTTKKARSFNLYKGTSIADLKLFKSSIVENSFIDTSVLKGVRYFYYVKSVDSVGAVSDSSKIVSGSFTRNIIYVNNRSSQESFGSELSPLRSILSALQIAKSGDTILLAPSTYNERISLNNGVVLASRFINTSDTSNISSTIISGSTIRNFNYLIGLQGNSFMNFTSQQTRFIGLTFQDFSGGLMDLPNHTVALSNSVIRNINANCNVILNLGSNSVIEKSRFINNSGNINLRTGMILDGNEFLNNRSNCNQYLLNNNESKIRIQNNLFINNEAIDLFLGGSDSLFVLHNTFYKRDPVRNSFIRFDSYSNTRNFVYNNIFSRRSGNDFEFNTIFNGDSSRSVLDISYNALTTKLSDIPNIGAYRSRSRNNFVALRLAFKDTSAFDLSLLKSSQAIGIGLDTSIMPNRDYFSRLRANPPGSRPDLGAIESSVGIPGPEITSLTADSMRVSISWTIIDTTNIANYKVYKSELPTSPGIVIFESTSSRVVSITDSTGSLGKTYFYQVQAIKRDSTRSDLSDTRAITLYQVPRAVYPLNNSFNQRITDTLRWNRSGTNVSYDIQLTTDLKLFATDTIITVADTGYVYRNLKNNSRYFWRLRVKDAISRSSWSQPFSFQTLIGRPTISRVIINGDSINLKFNFDTTRIKNVRIFKSFDSLGNNLYRELGLVSEFIDTLKELRPVFFKILLVNTDNQSSDYSPLVKVTTYTAPLLISPINERNGLNLKPIFNWKSDSLSLLKNIQISRDSSFNRPIIQTIINVDSLTLTDSVSLLPNTNYFWRVRAGDNLGYGKWSRINKFQTYVEPPILTRINPGNKVDTLYWNLRGDSSRYLKTYIYRDTTPNPSILIDSTSGSRSIYIDTKGLEIGKRYYYRLKAVNIENTVSEFSAVLSAIPFNTRPKAQGLVDRIFTNVGLYNKVRVTQTSTNSFDSDGFIKNIKWYVNDKLINEVDSTFVHYYEQGTNELKLVIEDNDGGKDSTKASITLKSFQTTFNGGILGGITAVSPDIIFAADSTYDPIRGAQVNRLDRTGKIIFPLIVSSKIFTTPSVASDSSIFITSGSSLNGFDKTGAPLWSTIPLGGLSYVTPTIDSLLGRLYVGVSNKNFFSFDYKTGKSVWNILCDAPINASAVITGDRKLVFVSEAGTLYGFNIRTGEKKTDPTWRFTLGESVNSSAAVDLNNDLYFGSSKGSLFKIRLNKDSSTSVIWKTALDSTILASPVIDSKGFVYVGTSKGDVYKVNPADGRILWNRNSGATIKSTPVITNNGNIVFANMNGQVNAFDSTGSIVWKHKENSSISANLLYINNIIYVGTEKGDLVGIFNDPKVNTINKELSLGNNRLVIPAFERRSLASSRRSLLKGVDVMDMHNKTELLLEDDQNEDGPVWGTFQGNYRRTGSRKLDCPETPRISQTGVKEICEGEQIQLTSSATPNSFWLKNGDVLNANDSSLSINSAGTYKRMVRNDNGCIVYSNELLVTVNKSPEKPVISLNGKNAICEGEKVQLSSSSVNNNSWYKGTSNSILSTMSGLSVDSTGDYFVRVTASNGCTTISDKVSITVYPKPQVPKISLQASEICSGDSALLAVNTTLNAQWFFNGIAIFNANRSSYSAKNAGVYSVRVSTVEGCNATSEAIDISVKPKTEIPSIITNSLPVICKGSNILLTATVNANNIWFRNGVQVGTGQFITVTDSGYYRVTATRTNMCTSQSDSLKVTITETASKPSLTISENELLCEGGTAPTLTSSAANANQWYKDGVLLTGVNGTTFKPTLSGQYQVAYMSNGCLSERSTPITVTYNPLPIGNITSNVNAICADGNTLLLVNSTFTGLKYQWYRNNVKIDGAESNSYRAETAGSYSVKLVSNGCERITSSFTLSVNPKPELPAATTMSVCEGEVPIVVSAAASQGNTIRWYGTNATGGTASIVPPIHPTNTTGVTDYYFTQVSAAGCESDRSKVSVTVNGRPSIPVVVNQSLCVGAEVPVLSVVASAGHQLRWYGTNATGGTASATPPTLSTTSPRINTFYVSQTNSSGCESQRTGLTVTVNATPTAPVVSNVSSCQGSTAPILNASFLVGHQLKWYATNATGGTATGNPPALSTAGVGVTNYYVSQISLAGCESERAQIVYTVNANPARPTINWNGTVLSTASGLSSYQWFHNNAIIVGANSNVYQPLTPGNFQVSVTNASGCSEISVAFNLLVTALSSPTLDGHVLKVYPNPTADRIMIDLGATPRKTVSILLYQKDGKLIKEIQTKQKNNVMELGNLSNGNYILKVINGTKFSTLSVIKY